MSFSKSQIADALEAELARAMAILIAGNVTGIVKELADAEDGILTVGFSVKLNLTGNRVAGTGGISYSRKFKDETDFITPDPDQPELPMEDRDGDPLTPVQRSAVSKLMNSGGGSVSFRVAEGVVRAERNGGDR